MKPVEFEGHNVVFAKDQPEYLPLPALKLEDGYVVTCWELTPEEVSNIAVTKRLYIGLMTFNMPLQPLLPAAELADLFEIKDE